MLGPIVYAGYVYLTKIRIRSSADAVRGGLAKRLTKLCPRN